MTNAEYRDGTPATPGVYRVTGSKHDLRRRWAPATGWSACWFADSPAEIIERAMRTPADRENVPHIQWRVIDATACRAATATHHHERVSLSSRNQAGRSAPRTAPAS